MGKLATKSLADFRTAHDKSTVVPAKIKAALAKLGKDSWEYEPEFAKNCGVSPVDFAAFRDQFAEYVVELPAAQGRRGKRIWAGAPALAEKMRELV